MEISLEHIEDSPIPHTFRVSFHSTAQRWLLMYPSEIGLRFACASGCLAAQWMTTILIVAPMDDFVLNPGGRISFDLVAGINADSKSYRWVIDIPPGIYSVQFLYEVDRDREWYDFLAKRSRFVDLTPIWRGSLESNTIQYRIDERSDAN